MCAITGIVNFHRRSIDAGLLRRMNHQLRHRGCDDEGYVFIQPHLGTYAEYSGSDSPRPLQYTFPVLHHARHNFPFTIGLAHRRFAIIDLTTNAHQPFFDSDRLCSVVVNGEIFNYLELRDALIKLGHKFRSASDVEVIVEAYKAWGVECFSRFNGVWAMALYDFRSRRLLLSRDRLGEIPLYWTRLRDSICFASEIKALCEAAGAASVNEAAIYPYLVHGLQHVQNETFFEGIFSFPAATWAVVDQDFPNTARQYWKAPKERLNHRQISVREAVRTIRNTLQDAVHIRLRADVPYCVTLSGGLDSSIMVALAAQSSGAKVVAHTIRFAEKQWDEESFARAVARHCGAEHRIVDPPLHNFWHETLPFTYLAEEPYHAPNIYSRQLLHRAMRSEGFKVVLVGEGSDELFGGYMRHFYLHQEETLRSNRFMTFLDNSVRWSETDARLRPALQLLKDQLRRSLLARFSSATTQPDSFKPKPRDEFVHLPAPGSGNGDLPSSLSDVLYQEVTSTSIPYWVRTNDRMRMGIPIEGRSPFLDYRIVELGLRLPVSYLIRHGWQKWILRKAFQDLLPKEIVWRKQKGGFPIPFQRFVLTSPPTIQTLLKNLSNPYVDLALFSRFSAECAQDAGEWTAYIPWWRMISFLLWYELFIKGNEELFARIRQEQNEGNHHVTDAFEPQFLHSVSPADSCHTLQAQAYH